jgi:hypothetical protein
MRMTKGYENEALNASAVLLIKGIVQQTICRTGFPSRPGISTNKHFLYPPPSSRFTHACLSGQ